MDSPHATGSDPGWTASYPAWIAASLRALADAHPSAETAARRLLGDDVRSQSAIRSEIAHLQKLPTTARVAARITNLRARLERGDMARPGRRTRVVAKIERAVRRARLAWMDRDIAARVRAFLPAYIGVADPPDWLYAERTLDKIAPVRSFSPGMRAVALRLLRARAGPPPWDLRDHPANRTFLDRLAGQGVEVSPWLDGGGSERVTTRAGKTIELRLEDDPLEILDMGWHFSTCLSPGDMNYFSAFANAADVNKRVLFARDLQGNTVGRCLLALTAQGGLLAFHAYAHDPAIQFDAVATSFTRDLARRMHVPVVASGEVPSLVAPDWYDDGPVDRGERFAFLQDDAPFRRSISGLSPSAFVAQAIGAFAPLPLGALTLPLLVALPELDARPDLAAALMPHLDAADGLPLATLARAVRLLTAGGHPTNASRGLVRRIVARVRRESGNDRGCDHAALSMVVEFAPSEGLRALRATRPRGVRGWTDERDPYRLEAAARAYEALRRLRRAAALYRTAAEYAVDRAQRRALSKRAAVLENRGLHS
jgi:hypothetical protein